jgi:hypothetical protein
VGAGGERPHRAGARRRGARAGAVVGAALAAACADRAVGPDAAADPAAVFEAAWREYDRHYPFFADQGLDWDAVYRRLRPQVPLGGGTAASAAQLFAAVCGLVRATGSLHSTLVAPAADGTPRVCEADRGGRVSRVDPALVRLRYLSALAGTPSGRVLYGPFPRYLTVDAGRGARDGGAIGYVALPSFAGEGWGEEIETALAALEAQAPLGAVIVDVRRNDGGDARLARTVAARFVDRERVYALRRSRAGAARDVLGPAAEARVAPAGRRFGGRVVVLTDRGTASAAEDFVLMLRLLPNVTVVGDTTSGTASQPLPRQLPNGWWLRVPATLESTPDGALVVEGRGLPPTVAVRADPADVALDRDRVLATALARLSGYEVF